MLFGHGWQIIPKLGNTVSCGNYPDSRSTTQRVSNMVAIEKNMSYYGLCAALKTGRATIRGQEVAVVRLEREDGSGKCWNVYGRYLRPNVPFSIFVRSID